jgi:hypothetical protein
MDGGGVEIKFVTEIKIIATTKPTLFSYFYFLPYTVCISLR